MAWNCPVCYPTKPQNREPILDHLDQFLNHIKANEHRNKMQLLAQRVLANNPNLPSLFLKQCKNEDLGKLEIDLLKRALSSRVTPLIFCANPIRVGTRFFLLMEKIDGRPLQIGDVMDPAIVSKVVAAIKKLHDTSVLHNDLKEDHIRIVESKDGPSVRIFDLDLGSNKRVLSVAKYNSQGIKYRAPNEMQLGYFRGTLRYASIDSHLGRVTRENSDFESLYYVFVHLIRGKMPWSGCHHIFEVGQRKIRCALQNPKLVELIRCTSAKIEECFLELAKELLTTQQNGQPTPIEVSLLQMSLQLPTTTGATGHAQGVLEAYPIDHNPPSLSSVSLASITNFQDPNARGGVWQQAGDYGEVKVRSLLGDIVGKQLSEFPLDKWPEIAPDHLVYPFNRQKCQTDVLANNLTEEDMHKMFAAKGVLAFPLIHLAADEKNPAFGGSTVVGEVATKLSLGQLQFSNLLLKKREQLAADNARLLQNRHPLEAVEVIRYSLLIVAVHELPTNDLDREKLKQRARSRILHNILLYPVDAVLAAVGRLWVLFVTNDEVGELIGKTLEALSLLSGEVSVMTRLRLQRTSKVDVWHSLSLDGQTRPNLLITSDGPTLAHFGQDVIHAYHLTADQIIRLEFAHRGQKLSGTSPIPDTTPEDQIQVIIAPHPAQTPVSA